LDSQQCHEAAHLQAHICGGLSDHNRIKIVYLLSQGEHNVTTLADRLSLPQPSASRHLKILRECGVVTSERKGHSVFYRLTDDRVSHALELLRAVVANHLHSQSALAGTVELQV
jgi:DNA-binding transcriptional ArsR family regulator